MTTARRARSGPSRLDAQPARAPRANALSRRQRKYPVRLRLTDSAIVCAAVALAQFVRFGDSPNTSGYPGPVTTLFSGIFAALWLSPISVSQTRLTRVSRVFGVGLGSGFMPRGAMAGEESFVGQQNSPWLFQNDIGKMIYTGARRLAQQRRQSAHRTDERDTHGATSPFAATQDAKWADRATAGAASGPHGDWRHHESRVR
jgi:hypothetical protein